MAVLPGQAAYQASLMGATPAPGALAAPPVAPQARKGPKAVQRGKGKKKKGKRPPPAQAMYPGADGGGY